MTNIPFDIIPGQGELYYDYLNKNPKLLRFYNGHHRSPEDISGLAGKILANNDFQRKFLSIVLREINTPYGMTPETEANIKLLEQNDTLTVITGRQAGMYTGALYTLLKAMTTIKLAAHLSKELGHPVVPMFWLESSDHDLDEVNHISFPGEKEPTKFIYSDIQNPYHKPVGGLQLGKGFEKIAEKIMEILPRNDFYDAITRLMRETYTADATFSEAFGKMLTRLLGRWGLVIIDSENVELKKLAGPVITMKLMEKGRMNQLIMEQSEELRKEKYHHQIKVKSEMLNVFIHQDNNRIPISLLGELMSINGTKISMEDDELIKMSKEHPELFSPKVSFRPIIQDFLFPNVAYVGGPAELAYFAQLKKVYEFFDIEMPVIWPRASATIVDAKIQRHMQNTGIEPRDVFRDPKEVFTKILMKNTPREYDKIFEEAAIKMNDFTSWMKDSLQEAQILKPEVYDTAFKKMQYQVEHIRNLALNELTSKNQSLVNSWRRIQVQLYPHGKLQERTYNILYFLSRYGFWLMDYLMERLDVTTDDHQFVNIPSMTDGESDSRR